MSNPNIVGITTINGVTTYVIPSNTSLTSLLSNANSSGHVYKVNSIIASNVTASAATVTVAIYTQAALAGTANRLAYQISVPGNASLIITDKSTTFYLMENQSIGVTSGTSSAIEYVISYEDIS